MANRFNQLNDKIKHLKQPNLSSIADTAAIEATVKHIIADVRAQGDAAVRNTHAPMTGWILKPSK